MAAKGVDAASEDGIVRSTLHLLGIPTAHQELVTQWMSPFEVCRFGCTCTTSRSLAHAAPLWQARLQRTFPDVPDTLLRTSEPMQSFANLAFRTGLGHLCPCIPGCHGCLSTRSARRCPCVVARTDVLPLKLGSLAASRSGSSALSCGGFRGMLETLHHCFALEHVELAQLRFDTLEPLDVLVICTTEGPALTNDELAAVRAWVEIGGALIASAFSNWSAHGHFAAGTVGWLGLETIPHASFGRFAMHDIIPLEMLDADCEATSLLLAGPFGQPKHFVNIGETSFNVSEDAERCGATRITQDRQGSPATIMFYPPRPVLHGGVTGKGQVLVCSNFHWIADRGHWNGGTFKYRGNAAQNRPDDSPQPNRSLLLNFIAGAIAARADD